MRAHLSCVWQLTVGLASSTTLVNVVLAQGPVPQTVQTQQSSAPNPKVKIAKRAVARGWRASPSFQVDAEYDNNVFLFAPTRKDNIAAPSTAEVISGRYSDMNQATDVLTTVSAGLTVKGPGLMGKSSVISPEVSYELYTQNTRRSNLRLGLSLQQEAWANGRFRLQGSLRPRYFARNYLADAIDLDASGSITDDERVYARGEYREGELVADYRLPFSKSTRKRPFGAALQVGGGFYNRSYDAPLEGRNLRGPTAGAKLLFDLGRRVALDVGYDYSSLAARVTDQILLLDEPDFGQDLNGNGTTSDLGARVLTPVDRSRKEHSIGATLRLGASKKADLSVGYEYRWRRYTSAEALDVTDRGRRDSRNQLSADLRVRLTKDLRARLGGVHSSQRLNRSGDPGSTGEIDDYSRSQARLGLSYDL